MRWTLMMGSLSSALALAQMAPGQTVLYTAAVAEAEAEVRSGPSTDARVYPTNRVRRGDQVQVLEELPGGWLKIHPPEGSFSWINTRFVERIDPGQPSWVVNCLPEGSVPVYVGSELQKQSRPTVEGCKVRRGTIVRSIAPAAPDQDGSWLPIEPPPDEVRYIRADAVTRTTGSTPPGTLISRPGNSATNSPTLSVPAETPEALWTRAQQADRAGQDTEAIRLYSLVAQERSTRPELASQALERARYLYEAHNSPTAARQPGYPASELRPQDVAPTTRLSPLPTHEATTHEATAPVVRLAPPCGSPAEVNAPPAAVAGPRPMQSSGSIYASGPGRLRRAGRALDNRPTYVLEAGQGRLPLYVTPQPGIDLEPYLDRKVELFGPSIYRGELRANYMAVTRVQPLPE